MNAYNIHQSFDSLKNTKLPFYPFLLPILNKLVARKNNKLSLPDDIKTTVIKIEGYPKDMIPVTIYEPKLETPKEEMPCLIYFHGGAFAIKEAPYHINLAVDYALQAECKVVFVDYRLLPKHRFPTGLEDGYHAYMWVQNQARALGIDPKKIAVGGDSAGGAIATGVALLARDRGTLNLCHQLLIYPVLDARQQTDTMKTYEDTPMWNAKLNKKMWALYLKNGDHNLRDYASPMEHENLADLPDTYVEVAEFDCLHDEGVQYANRLRSYGIEVELNQTKGTVHGYDMVEQSNIVLENKAKRIEALRSAFQSKR